MYGVMPSGYRPVIRVSESLITPPVQSPVTMDYLKRHLRSLSSSEDSLIYSWIWAAASFIEAFTGRQLITATREIWLDRFPMTYATLGTGCRIELPYPPLQSVTSVQYVDGTGDVLDFTDGGSPESPLFAVKAPAGPYAEPGWIEPIYGASWPTARTESGAVRIRFVCGYGDSDEDIPELLKVALAFLVGNFDQNRSADLIRSGFASLPIGVEAILSEFKYRGYSVEAPLR